MPKTFELWVGAVMAFNGLYILAWMPSLKKRLANRQQSGECSAEQARKVSKNLKLAIVGSLVVGIGLICSYAFKLD